VENLASTGIQSLDHTALSKLLSTYTFPAHDLYRGIILFEKGYRCISKLVKGMNDDLLADLHRISGMLKNHLCQLLKVHEVNGVWKTETLPLKLRWLSKM
jgi:hypothetical protein